jgi:gamma-glutamyl:cysteine ligase YbdK (ATP-grasp superfamily)
MLESLTTSLQVHLQIPASAAAAVYNASLAACAPLIALSANSPFALGRDLWAESRVPLFEQAVDTRDAAETRAHERRRVFLGDYADSPAACFAENLEYQPIVPPPPGNPPAEKFRHLRLHNGTIWRWVRPLLGENGDGEKTHIRIEHRVMPAGPTIADVAANIALCLGLIRGLWREGEIAGRLGAAECRENFYSAARDGLSAAVRWPDSQGELREEFASDLARERWLPLAREGLRDLEINDAVLDIVAARAAAGQNGAIWQRRFIAKHGADFARLTAAYMENSEKETPVYRWPI